MNTLNKIVFQSCKNGTLLYYGEGAYLGKKIPDFEMFKKYGIEFDCVLMENGQYAWSFQAIIADTTSVEYERKVLIDLKDDIPPVDFTWMSYFDSERSKWIMRKFNKNLDITDTRYLFVKVYTAPTKELALQTYKQLKNEHRSLGI